MMTLLNSRSSCWSPTMTETSPLGEKIEGGTSAPRPWNTATPFFFSNPWMPL